MIPITMLTDTITQCVKKTTNNVRHRTESAALVGGECGNNSIVDMAIGGHAGNA